MPIPRETTFRESNYVVNKGGGYRSCCEVGAEIHLWGMRFIAGVGSLRGTHRQVDSIPSFVNVGFVYLVSFYESINQKMPDILR